MFSDVLLTADFDLTITGRDGKIPQRNLQAIEYFMANGGAFTVNTGRSLPMAKRVLEEVPVNAPVILYNGSAWYENGELTQCKIIDLEPEQILTEIADRFPHLRTEVHGAKFHYAFGDDPVFMSYCRRGNIACQEIAVSDVPQPFLKFNIRARMEEGETVSSLLHQATQEQIADVDEVMAYMHAHHGDKLNGFRPGLRVANFHAKGASKEAAARELQAGLHRKVLVCVGDAGNDIPMLDGADYAFCPADGMVANRYENVCACSDGAIADVIYKKIPEILGICLDRTE